MNPALKRIYDASPIAAQNFILTTFSRRLDRQRYGGRFAEFRALMLESEWWGRSRMTAWQDERLRTIINHAYENVPYYRELFTKHGIQPHKFRGQEDLPKIPVLTRATLRSRLKDLISRKHPLRTLAEGHTSGTTGSPLELYYSSDMLHVNYAALDRQYRWAGTNLGRGGDKVAMLRGNVIVPLGQKGPPFWRLNAVHNQLLLSNFHLTPENLPSYFEALRSHGSCILDGYPSSVYVLAKVLLNRGERLPLRAVLTSSETLFDFQRAAIEEAFQCRIFDYFGAAERVVFAVECDRHSGHHLCEEYGFAEVLDAEHRPVPAGSEGYLVGTTLHNLGMPLIRYQTSDLSALKTQPCACGRPLTLMEDVATKAEDLLKLADGRLISPSALTHPFKPLNSIEASQIVQTQINQITVRLIPRTDYAEADGVRLVSDLKARLGQDMQVTIELVESLPRTKSGKFKWVISHVATGL
jgi:phenylacetate-CoA ligase